MYTFGNQGNLDPKTKDLGKSALRFCVSLKMQTEVLPDGALVSVHWYTQRYKAVISQDDFSKEFHFKCDVLEVGD